MSDQDKFNQPIAAVPPPPPSGRDVYVDMGAAHPEAPDRHMPGASSGSGASRGSWASAFLLVAVALIAVAAVAGILGYSMVASAP